MAGTLLSSGVCRLENVPSLVDVDRMGQLLSALGARVTRHGTALEIDASTLTSTRAPYEVVSQLRASFFAIGPLLARCGSVQIPMPGGCAIGARPVDLHVRGLQQMGAQVRIEHGIVYANLVGRDRRLKGAKIYLDYPSVGATETLLMAATLAEGETVIENAAREPEVEDLANFCRSLGARVRGAGTSEIYIDGRARLDGTEYTIVPDRIEAGTLLLAGAIARSEIEIAPVVPEHLSAVIAKLHEVGPRVEQIAPDCLRVIPADLQATDVETLPYPGFPTDMQAQFMALLSVCAGDSVVTETVFENRMGHVAELVRMGADIRVKGSHALIRGVPALTGAPVMSTDQRASAALAIAGLAAQEVTVIQGLHHMDRGYEDLEGKLRQLGARIERTVEATATAS